MKFHRVYLCLFTGIALLAAVIFTTLFGWKLAGFRAAQDAGVSQVNVWPGTVEISGFYPGSFPNGFSGYYAEEDNGTLYVGFRFNILSGLWNSGDFQISIPVKHTISRVVVKTRDSERIIWPSSLQESAPLRKSAGQFLSSGVKQTAYASVSDSGISLWDSPTGGQLLATADFPQDLSGAASASAQWDLSDLDADGTSDIFLSLTFSDGAHAAIVWFYSNGTYNYNEEFSTLPGELPAKGKLSFSSH